MSVKPWISRMCCILFVLSLAGCPPSPPVLEPEDITLRMHGPKLYSALMADTAEVFLTEIIAAKKIKRSFIAETENVRIQGIISQRPTTIITLDIIAHDSSQALENLAKDECDFVYTSRRIEQEEIQALSSLGDMTSPESEDTIALAGMTVIVHKDKQIESLSFKQLQKIFTKKQKNWTVYIPEKGLGTEETFQQLVLQGKSFIGQPFSSERQILDNVMHDTTGIGFVSHLSEEEKEHVQVVPITDGATAYLPEKFYVKTEEYPLSSPIYLYRPQNSILSEWGQNLSDHFVEFMLSDKGQVIVAQDGFVDLSIEAQAETDPLLEKKLEGINVGDSETICQKMLRLSATFHIRCVQCNGKERFDNKSLRDLDRITHFLQNNELYKDYRIVLFGFTGSNGRQVYNKGVSIKFAEVMRDKLQDSLTLPQINFIVKGFGENYFVANNNIDERGVTRNHRVEIWLIHPEMYGNLASPKPEMQQLTPKRCPQDCRSDLVLNHGTGDSAMVFKSTLSQKEDFLIFSVHQKYDSTLKIECYRENGDEKQTADLEARSGYGLEVCKYENAEPGVYYAKILLAEEDEASEFDFCALIPPKTEAPVVTITEVCSQPLVNKPPDIDCKNPGSIEVKGEIVDPRSEVSEAVTIVVNDQPIPADKILIEKLSPHKLSFSTIVTGMRLGEDNTLSVTSEDKCDYIGKATVHFQYSQEGTGTVFFLWNNL